MGLEKLAPRLDPPAEDDPGRAAIWDHEKGCWAPLPDTAEIDRITEERRRKAEPSGGDAA